MMNPRELARYLLDLRDDNRIRPILESGNVSYANWWQVDPEAYWFTRFIRYYFPTECGRNISALAEGREGAAAPSESRQAIRFYSVFGPQNTIRQPFDGVKVFYSGENLEEFERCEKAPIRKVSDAVWHARKRKFDTYGMGTAQLSMGFPDAETIKRIAAEQRFGKQQRTKGQDLQNGTKSEEADSTETQYLRFPLWITYLFEPEDDLAAIKRRIDVINHTANPVSCEGIACIASHDFYGTRQAICNDLERNGIAIQYAGKWRHNTDALQQEFGDDKLAYLHSIRFNICPENTDTKDYVTEKLFDAFRTGVIPIYHGSLNDPEPGLINKDAVLFWDYRAAGETANQKTIDLIRELSSDDQAYQDFMCQTKLTSACADYVWQCMVSLREALAPLL